MTHQFTWILLDDFVMHYTAGKECAGWYDDQTGWWHQQITHEDGRVERFVSLDFPGELFEDNP